MFKQIQVAAHKLKENESQSVFTPAGVVEIKASRVMRASGTMGSYSNTLAVSYTLNGKRISVANLRKLLSK